MSGPYDNQGYGQPYQNYSQQGGYPPQQGYGNQYPAQQGGYGAQEFGPPRRQDSYGPPAQGGFQHGQQGGQYGTYDASNPQGHAGYYGYEGQQQQQHQPPQHNYQQQGNPGYDAYNQNQQYQSQQEGYGGAPSAVPADHQFAKQSSDANAPNYDPNAPPMTESDRGLLGAIGGAWGGHHFGKKQNHGFLGTIGGAIAGSFAEDLLKDKKKKHNNSGSQYGGSSWGGSKW